MHNAFRSLFLSAFMVIPASSCSLKYDGESGNPKTNKSAQSNDLDPSVYTLSAELVVPTQLGSAEQVTWEDGQGSFLLSAPVQTRYMLRRTINPTELQQSFKIAFSHRGTHYESDGIRFSECTALTKLGYEPDDFRHMQVRYNFDQIFPGDGTPVPAVDVFAARRTGADPQAVTCEQALPVRSSSQLRMIITTTGPVQSALRFSKDSTLYLPRSVEFSKSLSVVKQTFEFLPANGTDPAGVKETFSVRGSSGNRDYVVGFQRCLNTFPQANSQLSFQEIELTEDASGELVETSKFWCCFSSGECSVPN